MELTATLLARVMWMVETAELNPYGRAIYPDLAIAIADKFKFQKFPKTIEEFDEAKGLSFSSGVWNGISVDNLTIFNMGIVLDTRSSSVDSDKIIGEGLSWVAELYKLQYFPEKIKRKRFLSQLVFHSEQPVLGSGSALSNLLTGIGKSMEAITNQTHTYAPLKIDLDFDRLDNEVQRASFLIHRRAGVPFSDNKYFSEAPLPTELHYKLLEQYEADLAKS